MEKSFYDNLAQVSLNGDTLSVDLCKKILESSEIELLPLLNAAYQIRKKYWERDVLIHILDNVQNGFCPEDCHYCAQSKISKAIIERYPFKSYEEIMQEAEQAYKRGAFRHCLVFSGKGPNDQRIAELVKIIKDIKSKYPMEVCVSPGTISPEQAVVLKQAGLNRLNHNINTSKRHYPQICTTHTYMDRLNTIKAAKKVGLQVCSGVIIGMGEDADDIIEMALTLRNINADSIPINFFIPIEGLPLKASKVLSPDFGLRVLCLFRFLNPSADIRIAAGRELHFRNMEVMTLFPCNSLFLNGYLNAMGSSDKKTLRMIKDAGFEIKSEYNIDDLLNHKDIKTIEIDRQINTINLKGKKDLHPSCYNTEAT